MINTPRHVTNIQHEKNVVYMQPSGKDDFFFHLKCYDARLFGDHYVLEKHANEGWKVTNANGGAQGS